jgi:hypothetical protein
MNTHAEARPSAVIITEYLRDGRVTERTMSRAEFERDGVRASEIGSRVCVMWVREEGE